MICEGHFSWHLGDLQKARDLLQRGIRPLHSHRKRAMLAEALLYLSVLEHSQGDYRAARQLAEECVALNREQGRVFGMGYALSNLGMICLSQGEPGAAYAYSKESVAVMRSIEHQRGIAINLTRLGAAALQLGRLDETQRYLDESLEITRGFKDRWGIGNTINYLGLLAFAMKDLERAESLIRESVALFQEDGDQLLLASTLVDLGYILEERNANADSEKVFERALNIAAHIQANPITLDALTGIAVLYARQGTGERAYELASFCCKHPSSDQQTKDRAEKLQAELELQFEKQWTESIQERMQAKTLDDIAREIMNR
jgi:tetratricopeptide (TPR) repeat protein